LDEQTAFLMVSLMRNVIESGTGIAASRLGVETAGKTGTTDDSYDAWFMAFTRHTVTGVWVGHDKKERPLGVNEQGGRTALPIWMGFMAQTQLDYTASPHRRLDQGEFPPPKGVVQADIDPESGLLARPDAPFKVTEWYRQGSEPTELAPSKEVFDPNEQSVWELD